MESLSDANEKLKADLAAAELARNVDRQAYAQMSRKAWPICSPRC